MSKDIHVVLLEDIASLGKAGDIVHVSEGYARNSLFPDGKAALATEKDQREHDKAISEQQVKDKKKTEGLLKKAESLNDTELTFTVKVKEGEEIFGSITPKEIVEAFNKQAGLAVTTKDISIKKPLKALGSVPMTVSLESDIECTVQVSLVADTQDNVDDTDEE